MTIGGETYRLPAPFLVLATQNPIESEGTYPLPEAQVDRFLFKLLVDYPTRGGGGRRRRPRHRRARRRCASGCRCDALERYRGIASDVFVDRDVIGYAVALADATRHPGAPRAARARAADRVRRSPRGPIGLIQSAQALALLRGRNHAVAEDVADLAADVLRHRLVLTYDALADGVAPDDVLERACSRAVGRRRRGAGPRRWPRDAQLVAPAGRQGPGATAGRAGRGARSRARPPRRRRAAGRPARRRAAAGGPSSPRSGPTRWATTCAGWTRRRAPAPARRTCASTCPSAR